MSPDFFSPPFCLFVSFHLPWEIDLLYDSELFLSSFHAGSVDFGFLLFFFVLTWAKFRFPCLAVTALIVSLNLTVLDFLHVLVTNGSTVLSSFISS